MHKSVHVKIVLPCSMMVSVVQNTNLEMSDEKSTGEECKQEDGKECFILRLQETRHFLAAFEFKSWMGLSRR